jgi:hypothetical protein
MGTKKSTLLINKFLNVCMLHIVEYKWHHVSQLIFIITKYPSEYLYRVKKFILLTFNVSVRWHVDFGSLVRQNNMERSCMNERPSLHARFQERERCEGPMAPISLTREIMCFTAWFQIFNECFSIPPHHNFTGEEETHI